MMFVLTYDEYQETGDPTRLLRSVRDTLLQHMRVLSGKYPSMPFMEKRALTQVLLFEAHRRHLYDLQGNETRLRKYRHMVSLMESNETMEMSPLTAMSSHFPFGAMSPERIARGYDFCEGWAWLVEHREQIMGETCFELQTMVMPNVDRVHETFWALQAQYLNPPPTQPTQGTVIDVPLSAETEVMQGEAMSPDEPNPVELAARPSEEELGREFDRLTAQESGWTETGAP